MLVRILHKNGRPLVFETSQVVVLDDAGTPLACSYEQQGNVVHCDATEQDWPVVCNELGLVAKRAEVLQS